MNALVKRVEKTILLSLIGMMMVVIFLSTIELGWILVQDIITPPIFLLGISELLDVFGFFLLILIGIELLGTIRTYLDKRVVHVEVVLEVALIAIARKAIIVDIEKQSGLTLLAIAALIVALAVAYYLEQLSRRKPCSPTADISEAA